MLNIAFCRVEDEKKTNGWQNVRHLPRSVKQGRVVI
jgi:hypothetical protein